MRKMRAANAAAWLFATGLAFCLTMSGCSEPVAPAPGVATGSQAESDDAEDAQVEGGAAAVDGGDEVFGIGGSYTTEESRRAAG